MNTKFSRNQALAYILDTSNAERPTFGMLVNGREFVFIKLVQAQKPKYARSDALSIEKPNEIQQVLSVLKRFSLNSKKPLTQSEGRVMR